LNGLGSFLCLLASTTGYCSLQQFNTPSSQDAVPTSKPWVWHISLLLLLGAGGALAVAGLSPLSSSLPVKQLVESVSTLSLDNQMQSLMKGDIRLYRADTSRSSDSADSLLARLNVSDAQAADFMRANALVRSHLLGRAGRLIRAEMDDDNRLLRLTARWATDSSVSFQRLVIERQDLGFVARLETGELASSVRLSSAFIQSSLFAATDEARIPDSIAVQLAEIFSGDIDFHRALRVGDRFSVAYETLEADGETIKSGKVLSAEFVNRGKSFQAMWFQENNNHPGGYYTLDGQSLRRTYLASPLTFSRISSGFKMRFHPILQTWRAHLGVDYAAPTGTAVRSIGIGVVESAGNLGGYGKAVVVKHHNGHSTVYAHLSQMLVKRGQSVAQGQSIGKVGETGWATGPHLHFEFRVNGKHQDPLVMARKSESVPVSAQSRPAFDQMAKQVSQQLASASLALPAP
jgi:murein DD-endopeptidase MepM/ murein hydrolase activator NlpD